MHSNGQIDLAGIYSVRVINTIRIAVGYRRDGSAPRKLDHFILTRYSPQVKGYVVDAEAMRALAEYYGADPDGLKPRRVPIQVFGNLISVPDPVTGGTRLEVPDSIMTTRMAYYWGRKCICASQGFALKSQERCESEGLAYPPDPDTLAAWIGAARWREFDDKRLVAEKLRVCNPHRCEFATGEANQKSPGTPLCKPQTILTCQLPFLPSVGAAAKFVTTSWATTRAIRSSLIAIGAQAGGWLAMLPLEMVVAPRQVSAAGFVAPVVHVEFSGDVARLRQSAVEVKQLLAGLEDQLARIQPRASLQALDAGEDAEAFVREFAPDVADAAGPPPGEVPDESDYMLRLSQQAGWSPARLDRALALAGGDVNTVIAELEAICHRHGDEEGGEEIEPADEDEPTDDPDAQTLPLE